MNTESQQRISARALTAARAAQAHGQAPVCAAYRAVARVFDGTDAQIQSYASAAQALVSAEWGMDAQGYAV